MRWFVKGDIDGFFGLAIDNLIQILLIIGLCLGVLGFPLPLIFGRVLPAVALSLILGNVYYSHLAVQKGRRERRDDYCALPYGINTPSVFIYVFLVMLPVKLGAVAQGFDAKAAAELAWKAGVMACLGSGVIEFLGSFVAERIRKAAPRAALLSTLSGIALGFIALPFLYRTFAYPLVGFVTLTIILLVYFGGVRFKGNLPGGLVAVVAGALLALIPGVLPATSPVAVSPGFYWPRPVVGEFFDSQNLKFLSEYITVIMAMGVFNVLGSLQNIESAEAAGDLYPTRKALMANGAGSLLAAFFGSCFPTTIYIGHPGWKAMGARAGYSILNAVFITLLCLTGTIALVFRYVPLEAGMAIVLWIGIVITAQSFQATSRSHAPASVLGILVGVGAWGAFMLKSGVRAADGVLGGGLNWIEKRGELEFQFLLSDLHAPGIFALEQGCIFTAMIFSAVAVYIIDQKPLRGALWCLAGALLSAFGLVHSHLWSAKDVTLAVFDPAWKWSMAYLAMAGVLTLSHFWAGKPREIPPTNPPPNPMA